ncbi:MAG TPA: peptidylprolyl isomerase [Synergistales bacterium]|nr:peptidylprolyl isomerase [Synergistales bacterium]HQO82631.1 peptidylprolyl isomerase [Synergistales bacterium]HQQ09928.1 peptidylprolyl isomerase [Synergistales bacterium]
MKSLSRKILLLAVAVTFAIPALAGAADRGPVISAGGETVSEQEMIRLIMDQSGADSMMAPFVLAQLSLEDRETFARQVSMALLLSEAALRKGLQLDPSVSVQLRWNAVNILAQAYVASVSSKWDLGRPALEAWFSSHEEDYMEPESVRVRHILVASEKEAVDVLLKVYAKEADFGMVAAENSIDPGSARSGGDLGWVYRGQTVPEFDGLAFSLEPGRIGGPVETKFGWHVLQVLEKRPARSFTFDEVLPRVREDMQQHYFELEVQRLADSLGTEIDHEILSTLGGFPAYSKDQ